MNQPTHCSHCTPHGAACPTGERLWHQAIAFHSVIDAWGFPTLPVDIRDRILMGEQDFLDQYRIHVGLGAEERGTYESR